jgi:ribokinase
MQREIPEKINIQASKISKDLNIPIVLDVGGEDSPISNDLISMLDIISPNETELERMTGKKASFENDDEIKAIINHLREESKNQKLKFLLKLGSKGSKFVDENNNIYTQKAYKFDDLPIVDTTGAGKI